jgi:predicted ester cyclase
VSIEENKKVVIQLMEMHGERTTADLVASDFINHVNEKTGVEALQSIGSAIRETFPDFVVEIEDVIAEDDKVVVRRTLRGTHQGSALPLVAGIPPASKPVEWHFIHIFRLRDGKIVEHWARRDDLEVRRSLGASE